MVFGTKRPFFLLFPVLLLLVSCTTSVVLAQQEENSTTTTTANSTTPTTTSTSAPETSSSSSSSSIDFSGHYRMTVGDRANFRALLAELGVGYLKRLAASAARFSYVISQNQTAGTFSLQTLNSFTSPPGVTFRSGVSFYDPAPYDPTVCSTITVEGNRWRQLQKGRQTMTIERTFHGNPPTSIDVLTKCNGVTVTRKYVRV